MAKAIHPNKSSHAAKSRSKPAPGKVSRTKASGETKQAQVLALLRRPSGATISAMVKATGWQEHSIRGFLAGTVRKKLALNLDSKKEDGQRIYRVMAAKPSATKLGPAAAARSKVA